MAMIRIDRAGVSTYIRGNSQQDIRGNKKNKSRVLFLLLLQRGEGPRLTDTGTGLDLSKTGEGACPWKTEPKRKREEGDPSYASSAIWGLLGGVRKESHQFRGREGCDSVTAGGLAPMVAGHHQ